jgi:stress-induced morphogen
MGMTQPELEGILKDAFPDADIIVTDLAGDGEHYAAAVYSPSFAGMSRVAQHQAVYAAFGGGMGTTLHALKLTTGVRQD